MKIQNVSTLRFISSQIWNKWWKCCWFLSINLDLHFSMNFPRDFCTYLCCYPQHSSSFEFKTRQYYKIVKSFFIEFSVSTIILQPYDTKDIFIPILYVIWYLDSSWKFNRFFHFFFTLAKFIVIFVFFVLCICFDLLEVQYQNNCTL